MKKYIVWLSVLFFLIMIFVISYFIIKHQYEKNYTHIYNVYSSESGSDLIKSYYDTYGVVPEIFSFVANKGMDIYTYLYFWEKNMKDRLSRESEEYPSYSYYKVYDRSTQEAVGYILLSTGIDGKKDIILSAKDTLYTDDYIEKIGIENLYIPNHYRNQGYTSLPEKPIPGFNLKDYFFGKKDLLLVYEILKER